MTRTTRQSPIADPAPPSAAVPPEKFSQTPRLLIRASAGTGKTFQLSNRYLSLLRTCPAERILAVTFTRKAAGEILERILLRLADAALNDKRRRELAAFLGGPELTADECRQLLASTVRQLHRVKVSTLDSFFSRLATSIPLEIGLPPNWSIADEHAAAATTLQAIDDVLRSGSEADTRRLVRLLAKGEVPRSITSLVTRAVQTHYDVFRISPEEAWRRIQPPLPIAGDELEALLIEHEQLDLAECPGIRKAHATDILRCRQGDWEAFLGGGPAKKLLEGDTKFNRKELPARVIDVYRRLIHHARSVLLRIWADQILALHALLSTFDDARRQRLRETGDLRFDDVAVALAKRLRDVDSKSLIHRLDGDVDHLLLDEFQDTSLLQWDVLQPFVSALDHRPGTSFFCVGDVKQAIYGWRGGVAALFDKVQRDVPGVQSGMLNHSRRSAPAILYAVNFVFQNLDRHPNLGDLEGDVREWQQAFPQQTTALTNAPGYVCLRTATAEPADVDDRPGADEKRDQCVGTAADLVAQLVAERPQLSIGVLTRGNEMIGRLIHELAARKVLASEEGGVRLATSAAIQLIQSLLRFADHPGDSVARFHVAHSPLGEWLGILPQMDPAEAQAAALNIRRELTRDGYEAAIERWSNRLRPQCSDRDWSRLRRLCVLAAGYESVASLRPSAFADRIEEERIEEPTASSVRVMTIHKSKGLEFDVVVLPDLDIRIHDAPAMCVGTPEPAARPDAVLTYRGGLHQSLLPPELKRAVEQQRRSDVHEALCCLYVAMTRAAHALHLIIAPQQPVASGETTFQKTAAGLVRAALSTRPDLPPETILFEYGNPRWFDELPSPPDSSSTPPPAPAAGPIELRDRETGRIRGRQTASPSHSERTHRPVPAARLLSLDAAGGRERGTLWHFWCQQIEWLSGAAPERDRLRQLGRPKCRSEERLDAELDAFLQTIAAPAMKALFQQSSVISSRIDLGPGVQARCLTESRFALVENDLCITGTIDRLILYERSGAVVGADVIDFKTDLAGPASPLHSAYSSQLSQYAAAVAKAQQIAPETVRAQLVWLASAQVETLSYS